MKNVVVAVVLVILVAGSIGAGYFSAYSSRQATTTTKTLLLYATRTITLQTTTTLTFQTIELSRNNGNYSFAIRLNGTTVARGEIISLLYNFTNTSGQSLKGYEIYPLVVPTLYYENGSVVRGYLPISFSESWSATLPNGHSLTGNVYILTAQLTAGQKYVLSVGPLIGPFNGPSGYDLMASSYTVGKSMMINATLVVT
jgi:hypothetical protein